MVEQLIDDHGVAPETGDEQGIVEGRLIDPAGQHFNHLRVTVVGRHVDRIPSLFVGRADIGSPFQEQASDKGVTSTTSI